MVDIVSLVFIGISAFVATNIDDIFILMMFFASSSLIYPVKHVVLGQYLGISLLVAISTFGSFLPLVILTHIIGLLGIIPIIIGIRKLVHVVRHKKNEVGSSSKQQVEEKKKKSEPYLTFLAVAAVTFSNGGDNIGVYTLLFAQYSSASQIFTIITVFMAMTGVWCLEAYYLVNHPLTASRIRNVGHVILPFVLIRLGIYIIAESFIL
jgi:cadmium resistance protein CadD (predicted permease)